MMFSTVRLSSPLFFVVVLMLVVLEVASLCLTRNMRDAPTDGLNELHSLGAFPEELRLLEIQGQSGPSVLIVGGLGANCALMVLHSSTIAAIRALAFVRANPDGAWHPARDWVLPSNPASLKDVFNHLNGVACEA